MALIIPIQISSRSCGIVSKTVCLLSRNPVSRMFNVILAGQMASKMFLKYLSKTNRAYYFLLFSVSLNKELLTFYQSLSHQS